MGAIYMYVFFGFRQALTWTSLNSMRGLGHPPCGSRARVTWMSLKGSCRIDDGQAPAGASSRKKRTEVLLEVRRVVSLCTGRSRTVMERLSRLW